MKWWKCINECVATILQYGNTTLYNNITWKYKRENGILIFYPTNPVEGQLLEYYRCP